MSAVLISGFRISEEPKLPGAVGQVAQQVSNTRELGKLIYSQYVYALEVAAVILLVAMIAAMRMHAVTDQMTIAWAAPKMARRSPAASTLVWR